MERTLQEQIEEHDYQLDDLDDLEEQTIFSPLDDAQIKIFKIGTIVFYLVAYFYTAILVQLKTIYSLPVTIGLLLSTEFLIKKLHTTSIPLKEGAKKLGEVTSYLAANKKAYHVVDKAEMERVTGTEHHGEMCLLVKKAPALTLDGYLQVPRKQDCLVLLDCVNNAQNVGGIVRTCAFYGVKGAIVESADSLYSSAAARVAEGGLEFVRPLETKHKEIAFEQLRKAGYQIVHLTRSKQAKSLAQTTLNEKVVFVLSEVMSQELSEQDTSVQLSFANPLNSGLNIAVNAGVLLNQWYQTHCL